MAAIHNGAGGQERENIRGRFGYRGPSLAADGRGPGGAGAAVSPGGLQEDTREGGGDAAAAHEIGLSVLVLSVPAAAAVVISLAVGSAPIGIAEVVKAFFSPDRVSPEATMIVRDLRLPRVLMALVAGGALSVSGVVFQAILKNPLADPFILGVSSGAALGTVIGALVIRVPSYAAGALPAFVGALATILIVFYVARIKERLYPNTMLLVGVIINAFFSAAIMAIVSLFGSNGLQGIFFWLMGDLSLVSMTEVAVVSSVFRGGVRRRLSTTPGR